jgi:hypothetical protein
MRFSTLDSEINFGEQELASRILNSAGAKFVLCPKITFSRAFDADWKENREFFVQLNKSFIYGYYNELYEFANKRHSRAISHTIRLTSDISIHCTIRTKEYKIFIEIFFDTQNTEQPETVLNIFKEKDCIVAHVGSLENVFAKAEEFLFLRERNTFAPYSVELSGSFITKSKLPDYSFERGLIEVYAD